MVSNLNFPVKNDVEHFFLFIDYSFFILREVSVQLYVPHFLGVVSLIIEFQALFKHSEYRM